MTETSATDSGAARIGGRPDGARRWIEVLVADAPSETDTILAPAARLAGWIRVGLIVVGGCALWAAILFGALAALRR